MRSVMMMAVMMMLTSGCAMSETANHANPPEATGWTSRLFMYAVGRPAPEAAPIDAPTRERDAARSLETWTFPASGPGVAFTEALVSWNIDSERAEAAVVQLRVGRAGFWSPWLVVGTWGGGVSGVDVVRDFDGPDAEGRIDVDYFRSDRPFDRWQARVIAAPADGRFTEPPVTRMTVCLTGAAAAGAGAAAPPAEPVRLDVPFRNQETDDPSLLGRLCSPASVAMGLAYHGISCETQDVAELAYDEAFDLYGNWPRAVQTAYTLGTPGYVTRFNNWAEVERVLRRGLPVIASIDAKDGELTDAPYATTSGGHLIVITGWDDAGGVFVNDPAVSDAAEGQRVYRRDELTRVWLERTKGTAYVLLPPAGDG